MTTNWEFITHI